MYGSKQEPYISNLNEASFEISAVVVVGGLTCGGWGHVALPIHSLNWENIISQAVGRERERDRREAAGLSILLPS